MSNIFLEIIFHINRRDDVDLELSFIDIDGNPINLTGATVFFTLKKRKTDLDDDAVIKKDITSFDDPTSGIALLELSKSDTDISPRKYYFDAQIKDSGGKIASSGVGILIVDQDVTIRTS